MTLFSPCVPSEELQNMMSNLSSDDETKACPWKSRWIVLPKTLYARAQLIPTQSSQLHLLTERSNADNEIYHRLPLVGAMFGFSIFQIAVAVGKDLQTVLICRFFGGVFGSCPLAVVAAIFSDVGFCLRGV